MDWFLYDNGLRHERVKLSRKLPTFKINPFHATGFWFTGFIRDPEVFRKLVA